MSEQGSHWESQLDVNQHNFKMIDKIIKVDILIRERTWYNVIKKNYGKLNFGMWFRACGPITL